MTTDTARRLYPVVLCGGSGTRLWPLSRTCQPKQFLPLTSHRSLLQETFARVADRQRYHPPLVICHHDHRFLVAEQAREGGLDVGDMVLEPASRGTAPAIAAAAAILGQNDPDALMLVLPSDHAVLDVVRFHAAVMIAADAAATGAMVTFGIRPAKPETGYGYIGQGGAYDGIEGCFALDRFLEKPDAATAASLVADGRFHWNAGIFVFSARHFLDELKALQPKISRAALAAVAGGARDMDFFRLKAEPFAGSPTLSVDHAVMEKTTRGAVVPVDMGWSDVGAWSSLWEIGEKDSEQNHAQGAVLLDDVKGSYIRSDGPLIAAVGLRDTIVVATDDAILIVPRDRAQDVKGVVDRLRLANQAEADTHRTIYRPWGSYHTVDSGDRFQVKRLVVKPGAKLSLQLHHHRAEHWVVVCGTARITRGTEEIVLTENQSTYIPLGTVHRLENPGKIPLYLIEVQSGAYLGEDDIVRFEDSYGRDATGTAAWLNVANRAS